MLKSKTQPCNKQEARAAACEQFDGDAEICLNQLVNWNANPKKKVIN